MDIRKLRPLGAKVIIKEKTLQTETKSGIVLVADDQRNISMGEGEVIAIGPSCLYVEEGDTVIYWPNATTPVPKRFGDGYTFIHEADLVAAFKEEEESNELG